MNQDDSARRAGEALARLALLAARLRAPDGCPWDREQTVATSAAYVLEEAHEALHALEEEGPAEQAEELGDVLFQVVFQAQLAAEEGRFDLTRVIEEVEAKMIRRHPHVFGEARAANAEEVLANWSQIKRAEGKNQNKGLLDSVPLGSPALLRAQRMGKKVAQVGFDWQDAGHVWEKVTEEMDELLAAQGPEEAQAELGDLLFSLAQWARHRKLDSEKALRRANARFERRFRAVEDLVRQGETPLEEVGQPRLEELWAQVKEAEREAGPPACHRD
ncbi:MAG: nucleoside triphosphate pyrophosphohydrolase [Deltaproteobacteria bacterium]|nr:nucleoside triphosphate pyrophosphohydrolase [Deltaproteobacteria bacterium]